MNNYMIYIRVCLSKQYWLLLFLAKVCNVGDLGFCIFLWEVHDTLAWVIMPSEKSGQNAPGPTSTEQETQIGTATSSTIRYHVYFPK
jgi:hypothetical protein